MKYCPKCEQNLPKEKFRKNRARPDGLQTYCAECRRQYDRKYWKETNRVQNPKRRKSDKEKRLRNSKFIWDYLSKNPCVDCGETDPVVLEFDHLSDFNKTANIGQMRSGGYSTNRLMEEINKCEVRCANCHRRKTAEQFGWYEWR